MLHKSDKECLEFWQSPLLHIGGAGLRYPRKDGMVNTRGSKDILLPIRSVGPMALANTPDAREKGHTPESFIELFGLDGEWFDCHDVENYLREKGVVFADDASFIDVEMGFPDPLDTISAETPPSPGFSGNSSCCSNANSYSSPSEQSIPYTNGSDDFSFPDVLFSDTVVDPFITTPAPENDPYFAPNVEN